MNHDAISFSNWKEELAASAVAPGARAAYAPEHCKARRALATVALVKAYLQWREAQSRNPAREAWRWFFMQARKQRDGEFGGRWR